MFKLKKKGNYGIKNVHDDDTIPAIIADNTSDSHKFFYFFDFITHSKHLKKCFSVKNKIVPLLKNDCAK